MATSEPSARPSPLNAVFAIVLHETENPPLLCGTGFFVDAEGTFVTAKHVLLDIGRRDGSGCLAAVGRGQYISAHPIDNVRLDNRFDIAVGRAAGVKAVTPLAIASSDSVPWADVISAEFSQSTPVLVGNAIKLALHRYVRKGNVLAYYAEKGRDGEDTEVLDLSFPALKGASGAPILAPRADDPVSALNFPNVGWVVGMLVGNVSRDLIPAHLERVWDDRGQLTEETKFLVPFGRALSWIHLRSFLHELGIVDAG